MESVTLVCEHHLGRHENIGRLLAISRGASLEDTRDVRMVHHREHLPLDGKTCDDTRESIPRRITFKATTRWSGTSCTAR